MSHREATGRGAREGSVVYAKWAGKVEAAFAQAMVDTQRADLHEMAEASKLTPELSLRLRFVQVEEVAAHLDRLRAGFAAALRGWHVRSTQHRNAHDATAPTCLTSIASVATTPCKLHAALDRNPEFFYST